MHSAERSFPGMADERMNTGLNVMRRMPPSNIEVNLSGLLNLMPEETDELLQRVDQPLQVRLASFLAWLNSGGEQPPNRVFVGGVGGRHFG